MAAASQTLPLRPSKRFFDLAGAIALTLLLSPLLLGIGIALAIETRWIRRERESILYRERRVSRGRDFDMLKFRTLRASVLAIAREEHGDLVAIKKLEHDPENLGAVGSVLKQWYLDELPQLWNVIRGEMSLVGPRPWDRRAHDRGLASGDTLPKQLLPGGIVGPVQMNKSTDRGSPKITPEHEYLEAYRRLSAWELLVRDLRILWQSFRVALRGEGF